MTDLYHIFHYLDKHYIRQQSGDYDLLSLFLCHQLGEDPKNRLQAIRPPVRDAMKEHYSISVSIVDIKLGALQKMKRVITDINSVPQSDSSDNFKKAFDEFNEANKKFTEFEAKKSKAQL